MRVPDLQSLQEILPLPSAATLLQLIVPQPPAESVSNTEAAASHVDVQTPAAVPIFPNIIPTMPEPADDIPITIPFDIPSSAPDAVVPAPMPTPAITPTKASLPSERGNSLAATLLETIPESVPLPQTFAIVSVGVLLFDIARKKIFGQLISVSAGVIAPPSPPTPKPMKKRRLRVIRRK